MAKVFKSKLNSFGIPNNYILTLLSYPDKVFLVAFLSETCFSIFILFY